MKTYKVYKKEPRSLMAEFDTITEARIWIEQFPKEERNNYVISE